MTDDQVDHGDAPPGDNELLVGVVLTVLAVVWFGLLAGMLAWLL